MGRTQSYIEPTCDKCTPTHKIKEIENYKIDILEDILKCTTSTVAPLTRQHLKKRLEKKRREKKVYFGEQAPLWAKVAPTNSECHQSISAGTRRLVVKWLFIVGAETRKPLLVCESVYFIPCACACDCFESRQNKGDSSRGFIFRTSLI